MTRRPIGVSIVAGRRPGLLADTLASFDARLFRNFEIVSAVANIDPIFGSEDDARQTAAILRRHFPAVDIRMPQTPSFGAAVRSNWARSSADFLFHLEDDWRLDVDIEHGLLAAFDDPSVGQVTLLNPEKKWTPARGPYGTTRQILRLGRHHLRLWREIPRFTAGPSFLRGDFARRAASLMDEGLDPEKQFFQGVNRPLERYVRPFRNLMFSRDGKPVVFDTGREWRDSRGIVKVTAAGVSAWHEAGQGGHGPSSD